MAVYDLRGLTMTIAPYAEGECSIVYGPWTDLGQEMLDRLQAGEIVIVRLASFVAFVNQVAVTLPLQPYVGDVEPHATLYLSTKLVMKGKIWL